jgi:hypothetical protein
MRVPIVQSFGAVPKSQNAKQFKRQVKQLGSIQHV